MTGNTITVGNVEVLSVKDGFSARRDPTVTFPESSIEQWREFPGILDSDDQVQSRYGSVVIRSQGRLVLVDTGMQTATGGDLLNDLRARGAAPEDIDIVFLTHLHPDHVGWNIDLSSGKPAFPNARYLAPRSDFDYWMQPEVLEAAEHVQLHVVPLTELKLARPVRRRLQGHGRADHDFNTRTYTGAHFAPHIFRWRARLRAG